MKRISIAFVASTFRVGGAERVLSDVITRLPRERFDSRLYFLRDAGPVGDQLIGAGISAVQHIERRRGDVSAVGRLARLFRRCRPDIVFCVDHHNAMLAGRLAGLLAGARALVVGSHSTGLFGRRHSFRWSDRLLSDFTDRVVALSETHARYLNENEGVAAARIAVIENGIDVVGYRDVGGATSAALKAELGLAPGDRVVIMVAALRPEKAHEALIDAAARLGRSGRQATFLVVGDGPRRGELEGAIRSHGLEERVRLLGPRADVARLLHLSDALALPSHPVVETLPLCVLEAMAAGVPVVASRVGSIPEVVRHGETGLLIRPARGDDLADALAYVFDHGTESAKMAARASRMVEARYTAERMVAGYAGLFESLAA